MKKIIAWSVLGAALLVVSPDANANTPNDSESRFRFQLDGSASSSPLDLARWLARRLNDGLPIPARLVPTSTPKSAPVPEPGPNEGDEVCPLDRQHCPTG